jgi:hypothetical protein
MSRSTWKFCILPTALFVLLSVPTLAQQVKGDSELGLSGSFTIMPQTTGNQTTYTDNATVSFDYGYYFTRHDLAGLADSVTISGTTGGTTSNLTTDDTLYGRYRHLFGGESAKVYPFVGGGAGFYMTSVPTQSGSGITSTTTTKTTTDGLYSLEGGLKFYVNPKTAFEVAYTYESYDVTTPAVGSIASSSSWQSIDVVSFGFTYVFGGPRSKH